MVIEKNIPLSDKNWFKTGGNASHFCRPITIQDWQEALAYATGNNLAITLLGQGANVLISDDGIDGLVICPAPGTITHDQSKATITADAGVGLPEIIDYGIAHGLLGLEEFSGIPGSVGGSLFINVHYFQFFLGNFLESAIVIDTATGQAMTVDRAWFNFGYDQSKLFDRHHYVVQATFKLTPADALQSAYARGRRDEIIRHRNQRYPNARTCGSFFRNFHMDELPFEIEGKKLPYVAYYLDKIGIKGELRVGNAIVSYQHANMIVTMPGATSNDVVQLARTMQQKVKDQFGIIPQSECQLLGFKKNPLL
ncbi:MAG: UDP-N-acetylmuramate dehydrogenase [Candidatus Babeliales bacterium]